MRILVDVALLLCLGLFSALNLFFAGSSQAVAQAESPCAGAPPGPDCTCCTDEEEPMWVCE